MICRSRRLSVLCVVVFICHMLQKQQLCLKVAPVSDVVDGICDVFNGCCGLLPTAFSVRGRRAFEKDQRPDRRCRWIRSPRPARPLRRRAVSSRVRGSSSTPREYRPPWQWAEREFHHFLTRLLGLDHRHQVVTISIVIFRRIEVRRKRWISPVASSISLSRTSDRSVRNSSTARFVRCEYIVWSRMPLGPGRRITICSRLCMVIFATPTRPVLFSASKRSA